jgi:hypothetical protein
MRGTMRNGIRIDERRKTGKPVYEVSLQVDLAKVSKSPLLEACRVIGVISYREYPDSPLKLAVTVGRHDTGKILLSKKRREELEAENRDRIEMAKGRIIRVLREVGAPIAEDLQ